MRKNGMVLQANLFFYKERKMNKTDTPTYGKVCLTLRLPPEVYADLMEYVYEKKKGERGFSINQHITEVLTKSLKKKK